MNKSVMRLCTLGAAGFTVALGGFAPASAHGILYKLDGVGGGQLLDLSHNVISTFSGVPFEFRVKGDTSTFWEVAGTGHGIFVNSAKLSAPGVWGTVLIDPTEYSFVLEGSFAGTAGFGYLNGGTPTTAVLFAGPGLVSYDAVSNLSPTSVSWFMLPDPDVDFKGHGIAEVNFTSIARATVSAQLVPEPATWATMLLGLGLIGAVLRRRTDSAIA
jgi:hypothetical protein